MTRKSLESVIRYALAGAAGKDAETCVSAVAEAITIALIIEREASPSPTSLPYQPPGSVNKQGISLPPSPAMVEQADEKLQTMIAAQVEKDAGPRPPPRLEVVPSSKPEEDDVVRWSVRDLSLDIQATTPPIHVIQIPMLDGTSRPLTLHRNVIIHEDTGNVRLQYKPEGLDDSFAAFVLIPTSIEKFDFTTTMPKIDAIARDLYRPRDPVAVRAASSPGAPLRIANV